MPPRPSARSKVLPPVRVEPALMDAVDRAIAARIAAQPGVSLSRSDVIRSLLWEALERAGFATVEAA